MTFTKLRFYPQSFIRVAVTTFSFPVPDLVTEESTAGPVQPSSFHCALESGLLGFSRSGISPFRTEPVGFAAESAVFWLSLSCGRDRQATP